MDTQLAIRPGLTMSKMGGVKPKKEADISDDTFTLRKLDVYYHHWLSLGKVRRDGERAQRYKDGDQWFEPTKDRHGNWVSEYAAIRMDGQLPLIQNIIGPAIRSLKGQFRTDASKSVVVSRTPESGMEAEMLSNALQYNLVSVNNAKELDAVAVEELVTCGLAIQKIYHARITTLKRKDVKLKNIDKNNFFFNADARDVRGDDVRIAGELLDYTLENMVLDFATSVDGVYSAEREKKIREIYSGTNDDFVDLNGMDGADSHFKDFYIANDTGKCRVIEVWEERVVKIMQVHDWMNGTNDETDWTQSDISKLNAYRIQKYVSAGVAPSDVPLYEGTPMRVKKWFYTFYSPYGHILREGETPFWHGGHPYISQAYGIQSGKIAGFVGSMIDNQRQINRLLIHRDRILNSAIKNPVFVDKDSLDGQTVEGIGEQLKTSGAVISLDYNKGLNKLPYEMQGAKSNMGIAEMLEFNLRMNDINSGVNPAMQGQTAQSGTSGKLYDAQRMQSSLNSKDIMESFTAIFRAGRDMKLLQTIQQYYDEPIMLAIAGRSYTETAQLYDPTEVRNVQFDLTIGQASDSPVYRDMMEETLKGFVDTNKITIEMWAQQTTMPFANSFLEALRKEKEQGMGQVDPTTGQPMIEQGMAPGGGQMQL